MRNAKRTFLIEGDPAYAVLLKWQAVGVCRVLDETGQGFDIINYTWPMPRQEPPSVPPETLDELGQWYDEILSHLRYWKQTRDIVERIRDQAGDETFRQLA